MDATPLAQRHRVGSHPHPIGVLAGEEKGDGQMSELDDLQFDHEEYAKQLAYTDELSRGDLSEPRPVKEEKGGLTRRDLLVKTGAGAGGGAGPRAPPRP